MNRRTHLRFASKIIQGVRQEAADGNIDEVRMVMDFMIIEFVN